MAVTATELQKVVEHHHKMWEAHYKNMISNLVLDFIASKQSTKVKVYTVGDYLFIKDGLGYWNMWHKPCNEAICDKEGKCSRCDVVADEGIQMVFKTRELEDSLPR